MNRRLLLRLAAVLFALMSAVHGKPSHAGLPSLASIDLVGTAQGCIAAQ